MSILERLRGIRLARERTAASRYVAEIRRLIASGVTPSESAISALELLADEAGRANRLEADLALAELEHSLRNAPPQLAAAESKAQEAADGYRAALAAVETARNEVGRLGRAAEVALHARELAALERTEAAKRATALQEATRQLNVLAGQPVTSLEE